MKILVCLLFLGLVGCATIPEKETEPGAAGDQIVWDIDNTGSIAGHETTVVGTPEVIDTPKGKAVEFDGYTNVLFVGDHPLAGAESFTAEVIFSPYKYGWDGQRFFNIQEDESKDRIMFVVQVTDDSQWYLNTHITSGGENYSLQDETITHPLGEWYHAALIVEGNRMRHYVNGVLEASREINFSPQRKGTTAIGARHNQTKWFKGAIKKARFTPRVLSPEEFLEP